MSEKIQLTCLLVAAILFVIINFTDYEDISRILSGAILLAFGTSVAATIILTFIRIWT